MKGLIFTYLLTYGGAVLGLFRPFYGFLIYVAFANLKPELLWPWSVSAGNYSRIVAVAFLIGWLIQAMSSSGSLYGIWRLGRASASVGLLLVFWMLLLVGTTHSPAQEAAWKSFESLSKVFLPVIVGVTLIDSLEKIKQLAWVLVITNSFVAYQAHHDYYSGYFNPNTWVILGVDNNTIAISMVGAVGLALFLGLGARSWLLKAVALGAAGLMSHVVLFSMSRGGMLALCITGVAAFLLIPKRPYHFVMLAICIAIMLRLAGPGVREEFATIFAAKEERDFSAQSRFDLTRDAFDCMLRHPLLGCGVENWGNVAPEYGWGRGKEVHNTWMQTGAEMGIPGFVSLLGFYLVTCWHLWWLTRTRGTDFMQQELANIARMVIAGLSGFLIAAAAVTVEGIELPYFIAAIGAGALKLSPAAGGMPQVMPVRPYLIRPASPANGAGSIFNSN